MNPEFHTKFVSAVTESPFTQQQDSNPHVPADKKNEQPFLKHSFGIFFDGRFYYWPKEKSPGYIKFSQGDLRRELKRLGFRNKPVDNDRLSQVDQEISRINREAFVDRSGPLAGHRCGIFEDEKTNKSILVTSEPILINPVSGDFPVIEQFVTDLLKEQALFFLAWLSVSLRNLFAFVEKKELYRPAPAIALCGPRQCGKTLLIEIIGALFGRKQSCHHWLVGGTSFNSELMGSELLTCDDESGSTDMRVRKSVGNRIKSSLFSGAVRGEEKGKEAFTARPWWRIVIATNDEPEDLRILPPLDDSMIDKLSLFKCYPHKIVMQDATATERWNTIEKELPAFVNYLLKDFSVPEEICDQRTGARAYQHPELITALASLGAEIKLLELIDEAMESRLPGTFTAREIQQSVTSETSPTSYEARRLLNWPTACGVYLGRLTTTAPDRVEHAGVVRGTARYEISGRSE